MRESERERDRQTDNSEKVKKIQGAFTSTMFSTASVSQWEQLGRGPLTPTGR